MISKVAETQLTKWIFWGCIGITILVTSSVSYDPVNVSKLLLLTAVGFAILFQLFGIGLRSVLSYSRTILYGSAFFLLTGLWAFIQSQNPKELAFFGTFGRNTGFLTYISLNLLFIASSLLFSRNSFKKTVWSLLIAGCLNVVYCLLAALGLDLISWNNIYDRILGTFGNPNFIGAFLGIFFTAAVAFLFGRETTRTQKIFLGCLLPIAFWEILESKAIQGLALSVAGSGLVIFFALRGYFKNKFLQVAYLIVAACAGGLALAGALQKGPLTSLIYKTSVSLRGEYWAAGLNMGFDHLFTGVGWDGFGEWFRRERRPSALILPGPDTVTNASHNVFIDIFAYGGLPLLLSYLFLVVLTLISSVKVMRRMKAYDPIFVALFSAWACYNLQALISINQIGLAIWGWVLGGALIGYEKSTQSAISDQSEGKLTNNKKARNKESLQLTGYLAGMVGFGVGLLIALPPFLADAQWRSALASKDANKVLAASTRWPLDSFRLGNNAILFEQSKLPDQAYELAKKGVEFNPQNFDSWRILYSISKATPEEKSEALSMMKRLDPLNKSIGK